MHLALYQTATRLAPGVFRRGKLGAALAGRQAAAARWAAWASAHRGAEPLIWIHAASVGETSAVAPVMRRLSAPGGVQLVHTFSSPSVAGWAGRGDTPSDYAPLDTTQDTGLALDALRPAALVFSRGDVWPVLAREAARREIPIVVVGGIVRPGSRRRRWLARALLRPVYRLIDAVGAVSAEDAEGWRRLGVRAGAVSVTGDPRHEAVLERPMPWHHVRDLLAWRGQVGPICAAGSVEPSDEGALLGALQQLGETSAWLIAPHEPTRNTVGHLLTRLEALGLAAARWDGGPVPSGARVIVATQVGQLADWYMACAGAYVGGGYSSRGAHSVAEPAAWAVPVAFGSVGPLTAEQRALVVAGGGVAAPENGGASVLARCCGDWLSDGGRAGLAARQTLCVGAALASAALIRRVARL